MFDGIVKRLDTAEERISELEDISMETSKLKGKEKQKGGKKIQELWDNYKKTCNISAPKAVEH